MRRPRGKPRMPAEEQAAAAWAYALSISKALPKVLAALRKEVDLKPYGLYRRSQVSRQSISDIEQGKCNVSLFNLALVSFVIAGSLTGLVRQLDGKAAKLR